MTFGTTTNIFSFTTTELFSRLISNKIVTYYGLKTRLNGFEFYMIKKEKETMRNSCLLKQKIGIIFKNKIIKYDFIKFEAARFQKKYLIDFLFQCFMFQNCFCQLYFDNSLDDFGHQSIRVQY